MQPMNFKKIIHYLYDKLTGSFIGFLIGSGAAGLVSHFFETRNIHNLWGLTAKKRLVNKHTLSNIEWIVSIIIGFLVFEILTKVVKKKIEEYFPRYKFIFMRWLIRNKIYTHVQKTHFQLKEKGVAFFSFIYLGAKNAIERSGK
ncbi:MAG: hypothetical protein NVS1B13_20250 [Flavisolibacter sp.]